jgi:hypothetical protein
MKEGFDREIDSLLRRRARGTAESRSWGDGAGDGSRGAHLDADELGAFAEGALPAAARVAAASHLADCERCRGVAISLAPTVSAGAEVKHQTVAATAAAESQRTPAWRALLASLFSPRAMRFAVPVLALSLVGVVSYVALRSKNDASLQTVREAGRQPGILQPQPNTPAAPSASDANANANANTSGFVDQNTDAAPSEAPAQPEQRREHAGPVAQPVEAPDGSDAAAPVAAAPPPPPPAASTSTTATEGPAEMAKSAPKPVTAEEGEAAKSEGRDRSENKDKSARASEPAEELAANEVAVQRNRAAQSRMNQVQMPDGGTRNEKRAADNTSSGGYNVGGGGATPKQSERSDSLGRSRAMRRAEKKADADEDDTVRTGDTRAAAGHRFRREGNRWVDVNYKPNMSSTGVRRGTEGFRALVADVPVVGRVAEAIDGEVIVVVGGRAYHIR